MKKFFALFCSIFCFLWILLINSPVEVMAASTPGSVTLSEFADSPTPDPGEPAGPQGNPVTTGYRPASNIRKSLPQTGEIISISLSLIGILLVLIILLCLLYKRKKEYAKEKTI
ncbi:LPXTG cell wall anchor domain-containing protein [Enterococcus alishanensis]